MAHRAKTMASKPAPPTKRASERAAKSQSAPEPAAARGKRAAAPAAVVAAQRVPPPSKGELRAHIEKIEAANAALKAKGREAGRAAKAATRRVAELEQQVAQLQDEAAKVVDPAVALEKIEAANATLKVKGREASRAAVLAERRIAELESHVQHLQAEATKPVTPAAAETEVKVGQRGRPPGRKKAVDPGDAVPPGVAVQEPAPLDAQAAAARDALEENLSADQADEGELAEERSEPSQL